MPAPDEPGTGSPAQADAAAAPAEAAWTRTLAAPITSVVVYQARARVTRRGKVLLRAPGSPADGLAPEFTVTVPGLPLELDPDSVRVAGRGAVRVLGVDVAIESRATTPDPKLAELEEELRALRRRADEIADGLDTERARRVFLDVAARTGAAALARGFGAPSWDRGDGTSGAGAADAGAAEARRLAAVGDALAAQLADCHARQRALRAAQDENSRQAQAVERAIAARRTRRQPDARQVGVTLEPVAGADPWAGLEVELELSYLVSSASWGARYDARLVGDRLTLTWFGVVTQSTGEDWPAAELTLSTARPTGAAGLPELRPWYVDIARPRPAAATRTGGLPPIAPAALDRGIELELDAPAGLPMAAGMAPAPPPVEHAVATVDTSGTAASYRPARPVPVPADGRPHRTTLAVLEFEAKLDYLTVPKLAPEAYLRAVVTNTSTHTLRPGPVSIFHGAEFVGTSRLELLPPGAEVELQLGVDDRLLVERELVSRATSRKVVGNTRRTDVGYLITLTNHTPRPATVTVRDQIPVSRHESISIRDVQCSPAPRERTDLGQLTWAVELAPGQRREIELSFRLEHSRGAELVGFTD
ncbi:MAG: DUF4139 domain-containing protein [Frankia sp.]|nr:DUF4139 domain-containing protein [Frankia sp.]